MREFVLEKKGYNRAQVDEYIARREQEVRRTMDDQLDRIRAQRKELDAATAELSEYRAKEKLIASALIAAGEKAQELDAEAKRQYEEEMEALKSFHDKWVTYYKKIIARYPLDASLQNVGRFTEEMSRTLTPKDEPEAREIDDIIARTAAKTNRAEPRKSAAKKSAQEEQFEDETRRLGGINMAAVTEVLADSAVDDPRYAGIAESWNAAIIPPAPMADYLNAQIDPRTGVDAAALHRKSESGFSFEEALHPTEELGDIMADLGIDAGKDSVKKKKK